MVRFRGADDDLAAFLKGTRVLIVAQSHMARKRLGVFPWCLVGFAFAFGKKSSLPGLLTHVEVVFARSHWESHGHDFI